jgi:hypothetical protein
MEIAFGGLVSRLVSRLEDVNITADFSVVTDKVILNYRWNSKIPTTATFKKNKTK